jgi:hypothetical protein
MYPCHAVEMSVNPREATSQSAPSTAAVARKDGRDQYRQGERSKSIGLHDSWPPLPEATARVKSP